SMRVSTSRPRKSVPSKYRVPSSPRTPGGMFLRPSWTVSGRSGATQGLSAPTRTMSANAIRAPMADRLRRNFVRMPRSRPAVPPASWVGTEPSVPLAPRATSATALASAHEQERLEQGRGVKVPESHRHGGLRHLRVDGDTEQWRPDLPGLLQE